MLQNQGNSSDLLQHEVLEVRSGLKRARKKIDRLTKENSQLSEFVTLDTETGLPNLKAFRGMFEREWKRSLRDKTDFGLILCEVDEFDLYRRKYGKQVASRCFSRVIQVVLDSLQRPGDYLARFKNEKLALILPGTNQAGCMKIGNLLQKELEKRAIAHREGKRGIVTLSVGAGARCSVESSDFPEAFFHSINMALFDAVNQGGNICVMA